ncbi:hypothetical protein BDZ45DRAFT_750064 [Acephala macrosclerotiorum]|nr:hypothetical protein BDZ45DRAFT_750064 [Acephala macrosclerotiorum]
MTSVSVNQGLVMRAFKLCTARFNSIRCDEGDVRCVHTLVRLPVSDDVTFPEVVATHASEALPRNSVQGSFSGVLLYFILWNFNSQWTLQHQATSTSLSKHSPLIYTQWTFGLESPGTRHPGIRDSGDKPHERAKLLSKSGILEHRLCPPATILERAIQANGRAVYLKCSISDCMEVFDTGGIYTKGYIVHLMTCYSAATFVLYLGWVKREDIYISADTGKKDEQ